MGKETYGNEIPAQTLFCTYMYMLVSPLSALQDYYLILLEVVVKCISLPKLLGWGSGNLGNARILKRLLIKALTAVVLVVLPFLCSLSCRDTSIKVVNLNN